MSELSESDVRHLSTALDLAERGRSGARPNPIVGAVLADDDQVLATGYHARWGERHAERMCLDLVDRIPATATLYVTLEPCSHHGKQPPCVDAIRESGVKRVVIAAHDPNPETAGVGPQQLEDAGIEVIWAAGDLEARAIEQNRGFRSRMLRGRPWVTYKWAQSSDGKLATGDATRRWVTGEAARMRVHLMRAASDAVGVGVATAIADNCELTVRGPAAAGMYHAPLRVVFDRTLRLPLDSHLVQRAPEFPTLVLCDAAASEDAERAMVAYGVDVWRGTADLPDYFTRALEFLSQRGVNNLFLESGPTLAVALHDAGLIDEAICFVSPHPSTGAADLPRLPDGHPLLALLHSSSPDRCGEDLVYRSMLSPVP
jgi:diaminohydroxyphosphoribosylaminopyrimidine deaminase/5-amino-6-(5-phosphoribosylamino)uracil reductase